MTSVCIPRRKKWRGGFTLIELLVVVAIIVVLIAILMPSLSKARSQAAAVACGSNLKQVGMASAMYSQENNMWQVPAGYTESLSTSWGIPSRPNPVDRTQYRWFNYLREYTSTYKVFNCKTMNQQTNLFPFVGGGPLKGVNTMVADGPGLDGVATWVTSGYSANGISSNYAYTSYNSRAELWPSSLTPAQATAQGYRLAHKVPEILNHYVDAAPEIGSPFIAMDGVLSVISDSVEAPLVWWTVRAPWMYVHDNTANVLYYDYHVERHKERDFKGKSVSSWAMLGTLN